MLEIRPNVELPLISAIIRGKSNSTPLSDSDWLTYNELTHKMVLDSESALITTSTEGLIDKFNNLKNIEDEFKKISATSSYVQELITATEGKADFKSKRYIKYKELLHKLQNLMQ